MKTVEQRLNDLENSNRRWKNVSLGLAGAMLAVSCIAAATPTIIPDVIYGRRFEIVNDQGNPVATIGQANGSGEIKLYNQAGKLQFVVSGTDNGGLMSLWNGNSQLLRAGNNGLGGTIDVISASGKDAARIGAASGQRGYVGIASASGSLQSVTAPASGGPQNVPQFVPQAVSQGAHDSQWFHDKFTD